MSYDKRNDLNTKDNKPIITGPIQLFEAKATRATKSRKTKPRMDLIDVDIPTINMNSNIADLDDYYNDLLQAYSKYLGYPTSVTVSSIKDLYARGLELYLVTKLIKRYYDSDNYENEFGKEINGIFSKTVLPGNDNEAYTYTETIDRIDSSLKGISNAVWAKDYISNVNKVLLPKSLYAIYDYYLSALFDVSNNDNKEAVTYIRFWPAIENILISKRTSTRIDDPNTYADMILTKTKYNNLVAAFKTALKPDVKNFVTDFLGWDNSHEDWTRDIHGNTVLFVRDEKVISTFNNIYPQTVLSIAPTVTKEGFAFNGTDFPNIITRYYCDFEQLMDSNNSESPVASLYYFGIEGINTEQQYLVSISELNKFILDYRSYPLMSLLVQEDASGGALPYVGGMSSLMTSFNMFSGSIINSLNELKQFCYGNDIKLEFYDWYVDLWHFDTGNIAKASYYSSLFGDYGEAGDIRDQLAIFNFCITLVETWRSVMQVYDPDEGIRKVTYAACINSYFANDWEDNGAVSFDTTLDYEVDHANDYTAYNTYLLSTDEVNLATYTLVYMLITGFMDYTSANNWVTGLFKGNQQQTQASK